MGAISPEKQEIYAAYRAEAESELLPKAVRFGASAFFLVSTVFILLDWLAFPDQFSVFLPSRLAVNVGLAWIWARASDSHPVFSAYAISFAGGSLLLLVTGATGGADSPYYVGLILLIMGVGAFLPITTRQASLIIGLHLFAYVAVCVGTSGGSIDWSSFGVSLFFLSGAAGAGVLSCSLLDGIRFRQFEQRSELERVRDDLRELDRAKSRFTANLHHELRTPLTLMLAPLEGMQSGEFGELPDVVNQTLRTMRVNGLRLLKLINNLLDLAKIESRQLQIHRAPFDLGRLARDVVDGARGMAERKGIRLEVEGFDGMERLRADGDALDKVFVNLVGNALKFTEPGGTITVRGAVSEGGVHVQVIDTGAGIPAEDLGRIFDRFAQVDDSATRRHEGTGIGLSLVAELVELHEGRVWAESEGLGHGATMNVFLPWGESDGEAEEEVLQHESGDGIPLGRSIEAMEAELDHQGDFGSDGRLVEFERTVERHEGRSDERVVEVSGEHPDETPEVLVAEDNTEMRRLLAHLLGRRYRLRLAPNGRLARDAALERVPDLVLTDVMMPEMSGTELCEALKDDPRTAHVPVVLVTSKAEREMKIEGLELGADDYVTKPFHPRELMARVGSLVRVARLQGQLAERNTALEEMNVSLERALAELKEAEVQIVQAERLTAVGELAAGVAHEVNNPLNFARNSLVALRTYVDDVREVAQAVAELDANDPEKLPQQLEELEQKKAELGFEEAAEELGELVSITTEGLDRTQRLVGDLRDFAAPRAGSDGVADVRSGVESTLALLKHAAHEARVEIEADLPVGLPRVCGNAQELNQVFLNLLKNALEAFDGAGGKVHVRATEDGEFVCVEFEDDGPGIDPAVRDRLFEPFVTSKEAGKGTGLGLSISRRIVREHGGDVSVESKPGAGTCFTVRLRAEGSDGH